jgi:hypothetical protein
MPTTMTAGTDRNSQDALPPFGFRVPASVTAILIWQRRRAGGYLLLAAALVPNILNLAYGQPLRMPGLLMMLAIISVVMNWTYLDR